MTSPKEEPPAPVEPLPLRPVARGARPTLAVDLRPSAPGLEAQPFPGFDQAAGPAIKVVAPPLATGSVASAVGSFGCSALSGLLLLGFIATPSLTSGAARSYRLARLERERAIEAAQAGASCTDGVRARLLARAGLTHAVAEMGPWRSTGVLDGEWRFEYRPPAAAPQLAPASAHAAGQAAGAPAAEGPRDPAC